MIDMKQNRRMERPERMPNGVRQPAGHWLETVSHLDPKYGGLSAVVPQLSSRLAATGHLRISLAAFCSPGEQCSLGQYPELTLTRWPLRRSEWLRDSALRTRFRELLAHADGTHIHGLWESSTAVAARTARSLDMPYIVSTHGMLEPWALANKGLKKRIYASLIERKNLEGASCLHALTSAEAEDYRRFGCKQPIAIIPNGVDLPRSVDTTIFVNKFPELQGRRVILFLGRIHFKKGLDLLVDAWSALAARFPDTCLVLAGPDSEDSRRSLEARIASRSIPDKVLFTGMLDQQTKWSALSSARCFVLPSYSEGLSVATLEAMGMGLPVIVSKHCHLPEVTQVGAGWEIEADVVSLTAALEEMLRNSDATNAEIGNHGRRVVHERYTWERVGHQMSELYRWVQHGRVPETFALQIAGEVRQ